jgi:hypothetical protein
MVCWQVGDRGYKITDTKSSVILMKEQKKTRAAFVFGLQ